MNVVDEALADQQFVASLTERMPDDLRDAFVAKKKRDTRESDYERWLKATFPRYVTAPLGPHHRKLWDWVWSLDETRPPAFVAVWNRGGAKSTSAEMACVALGCRRKRRYGWYVSRTQDQADDHVGNVAGMLESKEIAEAYPEMGEKLVGKFGNSQGWRRNRLRTASGFTVDALGLDTARRGGKLGDQRPDFIVVDDIDKAEDSPKVVRRLISVLTKAIFPSGAKNVAILAIQNLIHNNGVFAKLLSGAADFLRRRSISGPIPALRNFAYKQNNDGTYTITSGQPTWEGYGLERCESDINDFGPDAFLKEAQHEVDRVDGAHWSREQLNAMRVATTPDLVHLWVGVDPSGGDGPDNDEQGIVVAGLGADGCLYVLDDLSCKLRPAGWGGRALKAYYTYECDGVLGEQNFGGQMVEDTIRGMDENVSYEDAHAARGKVVRIGPVAALCGSPDDPEGEEAPHIPWAKAKLKLVGSFPELEDEMVTYTEDSGWSPNRLDALTWVAHKLMLKPQKRKGGVLV